MLLPARFRIPRHRLFHAIVATYFLYIFTLPTTRLLLIQFLSVPAGALAFSQEAAIILVALALCAVGGLRQARRLDAPSLFAGATLFVALSHVIANPTNPLRLYALHTTVIPLSLFFIGRHVNCTQIPAATIVRSLSQVTFWIAMLGIALATVFKSFWLDALTQSLSLRDWDYNAIGRAGLIRWTSTLLEPVVFGSICSFGLLMHHFMLTQRFARRWLLSLAMMTCAAGCLFSLTRGAWLTLAVAIAFLVTIRLSVGNLVRSGAASLAVIAAIVLVAIFGDFSGLDPVVDAFVQNDLARFTMWIETIQSLPNLLTGFGLGSVGIVGERFREDLLLTTPLITDGYFLKLLAEGGLPLLLSFGAFVCSAIFTVLTRSPGVSHAQRHLSNYLAAFNAGLAIQATFSNVWEQYGLSHLSYFTLGLIVAIHDTNAPIKTPAPE